MQKLYQDSNGTLRQYDNSIIRSYENNQLFITYKDHLIELIQAQTELAQKNIVISGLTKRYKKVMAKYPNGAEGCCCLFDDDGNLIRSCGFHKDLIDQKNKEIEISTGVNNPCKHLGVESFACKICGYPDPRKIIKSLKEKINVIYIVESDQVSSRVKKIKESTKLLHLNIISLFCKPIEQFKLDIYSGPENSLNETIVLLHECINILNLIAKDYKIPVNKGDK